MIKKLSAVSLAFLMLTSLFVTSAFAVASEPTDEVFVTSSNEFEQIEAIRSKTDQELMDYGLTKKEVNELRNFSYEEAMYERAQMSDEELAGLGYTPEQIKILHDYNGEKITADSPVVRAASTVTGLTAISRSGTTGVSVKYSWTWNAAPTYCFTDIACVQAKVTTATSIPIGATVSSKYGYAYYSERKGMSTKSLSLSVQTDRDSIYDSVSAKFPARRGDTQAFEYPYTGYIQMVLSPLGSNPTPIGGCEGYGAYGHSTLVVNPGISFTNGHIDFSFTPSITVKTMGANKKVWPR